MAAVKDKRKVSILGAVLVAALLGLVIGAVIFNAPGTPLPSPPKIEFTDPYDDTWGKLDAPVTRCGVTHILVGWTGASPDSAPKEPRTKEEARKLVDTIWHRYKNDPTPQNWKALQKQYNEDDKQNVHEVYPIPGNLVPEFQTTGKSTKVGFARICESKFGYHLIRRES